MRVFYGILDSFLVNAYAILTMNKPNFGGNRNDKRVHFMKEIAKFLITPHAQSRFEAIQTPRIVKLVIESCGMKKSTPAIAEEPGKATSKKRCYICPREADRKVRTKCSKCQGHICSTHSVKICPNCP